MEDDGDGVRELARVRMLGTRIFELRILLISCGSVGCVWSRVLLEGCQGYTPPDSSSWTMVQTAMCWNVASMLVRNRYRY